MPFDERMYTTFTQRDLNSVYFSNAIKYDPFNYTFKKTIKLLPNTYPGFMCTKKLITESNIAEKIYEFWKAPFLANGHIVKCDILKDIETVLGIPDAFDKYNNHSSQSPSSRRFIYNLCDEMLICNSLNGTQLDHYRLLCYIFPKTKKHWKDIEFTKFKDSKIFEALIRLSIALDSKNSISKYLLYAYTEYRDNSLESLINTEHLKEILNSKNISQSLIFDTVFNKTNICMNLETYDNLDYIEELMDLELDITNDYTSIEPDTFSLPKVTLLSYLQYITFGIEVLYHIYNMKDDIVRQTLYDCLKVNYKNNITNFYLYNVNKDNDIEFSAKILDIFKISDNEARYIAIKEFIKKLDYKALLTQAKDFTTCVFAGNNINICNLNDFLTVMVNYAHDLSLHYIRIEYLNILIDYCKLNKIDIGNAEREKNSLDTSLGLSDVLDDDDDDEDDDWEDDEDDSSEGLLNDDFVEYSDDVTPKKHKKSKKHIKDEMYDELDKTNTAFKYNSYSYNVKDVTSFSSTDKDIYDKIASTTYLLNRNLIKQIKDIKVYNTGGKNPGESSGKLDIKNIHKYKTTSKIFFKNTYKVKESDLAFGIVLDVSGSMWGEGIKNGKATMIVLHETLKALSINHSIITHTSNGHHQCEIRRYQSFKEDKTFKVNKNYALANITDHNGNCDSAALCYMEKALLKTKNKDKICLIFSDGQPTECSDKELKLQVKHMESEGIKVIGIGVNFSEIKRYYTDYANGKNLKEMLDIVSKILKQYILDKDD